MTLALVLLLAQTIQAPSTVNTTTAKDGTKTVEIQNVSYLLRDKMILKKTAWMKQIVGDKGMEGTVTLEAWPLGSDMKQKPLYALKTPGSDGQIVDYTLFVVDRQLDGEDDWWTVYNVTSGKRLFDTHLPLASYSISRETLTTRYLGFEGAADDSKDARLKQPKVIGVLTYASEDRVIREWLLTCDDPKRAQLLRSFADATRKLAVGETAVTLSFRDNYPSPPNPADLVMPMKGDDLDMTKLPAQFHLTPWRR